MSDKNKDTKLEPSIYAGIFGGLCGALLLPVFTIWLCSFAAPQISYLDKEFWVKFGAALQGAILGGGTAAALVKLRNDAYGAGVTAFTCGFNVILIVGITLFRLYNDVQKQPVNLERLSFQSLIVEHSLATLWAVTLIIWSITLRRKNKHNQNR